MARKKESLNPKTAANYQTPASLRYTHQQHCFRHKTCTSAYLSISIHSIVKQRWWLSCCLRCGRSIDRDFGVDDLVSTPVVYSVLRTLPYIHARRHPCEQSNPFRDGALFRPNAHELYIYIYICIDVKIPLQTPGSGCRCSIHEVLCLHHKLQHREHCGTRQLTYDHNI